LIFHREREAIERDSACLALWTVLGGGKEQQFRRFNEQQAALLVTALLPPAIAFHLLRVVLAVLLPIARVSLAPLVRTLPADLLVK